MSKIHETVAEAKAKGFATFNQRGEHICVAIEEGYSTISAKLPDGSLVTFAFCPSSKGHGHECIDIVHHNHGSTMKNGDSDVPMFAASLRNCGSLIAASPDVTLVSVSLRRE